LKHVTPDDVTRLETDKLLITDQAYKQIFTPYLAADLPVFVTADSLLNAYHVLYEESVRRLERRRAGELPKVLRVLWDSLDRKDNRRLTGNARLAAAARRRARIVLGTALKLLGDDALKQPDDDVAAAIDAEVRKVLDASARDEPDWLGQVAPRFAGLDYSRFRPVGFYAGSAQLEPYFRATAWLQAVPFSLEDDEATLAILLIADGVPRHRGFLDGRNDRDAPEPAVSRQAFQNYFRGLEPFSGEPDDWDLITAAEALPPLGLKLDLGGRRTVRSQLPEGLDPANWSEGRTNDQLLLPPENLDEAPPSIGPNVRILSAARVPDAELFSHTTDPAVPGRAYPSGLDVCAALGSAEARGMLPRAKDGGTLVRAIDEHRLLGGGGPDDEEGEEDVPGESSLYVQYLGCLAALVDEPEPDAPPMASSRPWRLKNNQAALAGWAQLRHTWALHAKEAVSFWGGAQGEPGFVEPDPEFFARMAALAERTEDALDEAGVFGVEFQDAAERARALAALIEAKDFAARGANALADLTDAERAMLKPLIRRAAAVDGLDFDAEPADKDALAKGLAESASELREAASAFDRGAVADNFFGDLFLPDAVDLGPSWGELTRTARRLESMAHKQLRGVPFGAKEKEFLSGYGITLSRIMLYRGEGFLVPEDDAPRVASVFHNPARGRHLAAAIGRARELLLLYPAGGRDVLCRGAVMPYFEFTHPQRLSDDQWRALLDSAQCPKPPGWLRQLYGAAALGKPRVTGSHYRQRADGSDVGGDDGDDGDEEAEARP
jgi:hypothetical protein